MKAPPLAYVRATSLADALRLWREAGPEARLLAGGQTLLASLAFRLSDPGTLIDITRIAELRGISASGQAIRVGALTTHAELGTHELLRRHVPLLAEAVPLIAHAAIRNRGTIGGSLAYADPAAELPACVVALDATVIARSDKAERRIPAGEFFTGLYTTALAEHELIAAVEFPVAAGDERSAILELARRSGDYAMAGVVGRTRINGAVLAAPKLVFFGVGDGPVVARRASAALTGKAPVADAIGAAQAALDDDLNPGSDQHGGPEMKRQLARVLLGRIVRRLAGTEEARAA